MPRRRRPPTVAEVAQLFALFGVDLIARLRLCETPVEQLEAFKAAKAEVKIYHRRLAMQHHPDRGGDADKLKEINAAWTQIDAIDIRPRPQPVRKSALSVSEVQGTGSTSVYVGVTRDSWTSSTSTTSSSLDEFRRIIRVVMDGRIGR